MLGSVAVGAASALVGAVAGDAAFGNVARVRVTVISGSSFSSVFVGLAPALAAAVAEVAVSSRWNGSDGARPAERGRRPPCG